MLNEEPKTVIGRLNPKAVEEMKPAITPDGASTYRDYLKDRSIVIIGGSDAYSCNEIGHYDIVVRINNHWLRQKGRCDVVYTTVLLKKPLHVNQLQVPEFRPHYAMLNLVDTKYEYNQKEVPNYLTFAEWCQSEQKVKIGFFAQGVWLEQNPYGEQYEWLNLLHHQYDTKFLTGVVALADIIRYSPKRIFVCGMDMYKKEVPPGALFRESHGMPGNIQFLKDVQKRDSRVVYDTPLKRGIKQYCREQ